jgi:flagellar FliL protein
MAPGVWQVSCICAGVDERGMMSDTKEVNAVAGAKAVPAAAKGGVGLVPLVLVVLCTVMIVLGAVGGGAYWLARSGKLPVPGVAAAAAPAAAKVEKAKTRMVLLEPLLVNLSDQGGGGYLRVVVALEVEDPPPAKDAKPKEEKPAEKGKIVVNPDEVKMRDTALAVMGRETSDSLLAADGKDRLKQELKQAISAKLAELKIVDVMFTEFLVQR